MKNNTMRDILTVLFKYKTLMLLLFVIITAIGSLGTFLMSPAYESSAKILVRIGRENVYMPKNAQGGANPVVFDPSKDERINSEVEIIKSRNLIEQVVQSLKVDYIYPDIDKKITFMINPFLWSLSPFEKAVYLIAEKDLKVQRIIKSDIIEVRFMHENPLVAAEVANKLIKAYLQHHLKVFAQFQELGFFDEQVKYLKHKLDQSEAARESFCKENNIISLAEQKTFLLQQISVLESELTKTRSDISENEGKLEALQGNGSISKTSMNMGEETDFNPNVISSLRNRLTDLKMQEAELLNKYPADSGLVVNIRKEMKKAQELLDREEKTYHDKAMTSTQHTLIALNEKEESQKIKMRQLHGEMSRLNALDQRYKELNRQVEIDESNYQLHAKHMEEARISNAMDTQKIANISVVQDALPPLKPSKPILWLNLLLSALLGFIVSIGTVFVISALSHGFRNAEDVQRHLNLPVLASVTEIKSGVLQKGAK